jgi:hypothetical protein
MTWSIEPVDMSQIKRRKQQPNYAFVEQAISNGAGYTISGSGSGGYFIVAPELSLVPGFVVELALPELAAPEEYEKLAVEMASRSFGVLWFDASDQDACDFAWRLGLTVRSGPPLFVWDAGEDGAELDGWDIAVADDSDRGDVVRLLTSAPLDAGGQTEEAAIENLRGGCVMTLKRDGDLAGAAVLSPLPGAYTALTGVIMETYSELALDDHERASRALELAFMHALGARAARNGLTMTYSMAKQTPTGYTEALYLEMKIAKQSFMTDFGTAWRS